MCTRFALHCDPETLRATFGTQNAPNFPPRYNIAPTQGVHIVRLAADGARELALVRWGLLPSWVKDPENFSTLVNARAETAAQKPSFRAAMRRRRCLVPADGFIEWTGERGAKRPFYLKRRDRGVLAFAALWEHWQGADGAEIESAAILTTRANATLSPLHDRMPVILDPDEFDAWLDCKRLSPADVAELMAPADDALLEAVELDPRINNPRNDGPELLEAVRQRLL